MRSRSAVNLLLALAAAATLVVAFWVGSPRGDFGGTDATATTAIEEGNPTYSPWFHPLWEPGGGEVESGLFALQAALGAGVVGFALGTYRERRKHRATASPASDGE